MPTVDGGYISSSALESAPTGGGLSSNAVAPFPVGAGVSSNVDVDVPPEVVLLSYSPDPLIYGAPMVVNGINMHMVQAMYINGVSVPWALVSQSQVLLQPSTSPGVGVREIYAESV